MAPKKNKGVCGSYYGGTCRAYTYTCQGHRTRPSQVYLNRVKPLDLIEARNVNDLKAALRSEIANRLNNSMYKFDNFGVEKDLNTSLSDVNKIPDAKVGETAEAGPDGNSCQFNKLDDILKSLKKVCVTIDNQLKEPNESMYISAVSYLDEKIAQDDLMEAENAAIVSDGITGAMKDCICYSDCASFFACSCYGNCGCNYGG